MSERVQEWFYDDALCEGFGIESVFGEVSSELVGAGVGPEHGFEGIVFDLVAKA